MNDIKTRLLLLPELLKEARVLVLKKTLQLHQIIKSRKSIEIGIRTHVLNALDENGKPLYKNQQSRDDAEYKIMLEDNRYKPLQEEHDKVSYELELGKIELASLIDELKVLNAYTRLADDGSD